MTHALCLLIRRLVPLAIISFLVACAASPGLQSSAPPPIASPSALATSRPTLPPASPTPRPTLTPAPPTPTPPLARPLQLISRSLPVVASSEYSSAVQASDADYNTVWRSKGVPATLTYDLSALLAVQRAQVLLAWYNDTYGYTTELGCRGVGYNNLGAYSIEANPGPGGGSPPEQGWVKLVTVADNTFHSRQHLLNLDRYNWLRLHATASHGSPQNQDIALNLDLYAVSGAIEDGWIFFGDSITAGAMGHNTLEGPGGAVLSFADQLFAATGSVFPPQENAGVPCITTADLAPVFGAWVTRFPGRFVAISLGSNDAQAVDPADFYHRYTLMVETTLAAGKIPVIPTIPWSPDAERQARTLDLNAEIFRIYRAYPEVVRGPDLWRFFADRPELISDDQLHPSKAGYAAYRQVWAATMAKRVYGAASAAP